MTAGAIQEQLLAVLAKLIHSKGESAYERWYHSYTKEEDTREDQGAASVVNEKQKRKQNAGPDKEERS